MSIYFTLIDTIETIDSIEPKNEYPKTLITNQSQKEDTKWIVHVVSPSDLDDCLDILKESPQKYSRIFVYFPGLMVDLQTHPQCEQVIVDGYVQNQIPTEETHYIQLLETVLDSGEEKPDRTGVGTVSMFGPQIVFDLRKGFPLLTTKRLNFLHIANEVLWYLSGDTSIEYLVRNGVKVWNANTSRAFLDQRGLTDYKEGETGPLYGFQWRHFGGDFRNPSISPGIDQFARVLDLLRKDPHSRRLFISAWNPVDLDKMCLEPCHVSFQLYVSEEKYLNGKLYMRSNDLFLGAPWNIAAYALLLHMFAHLSGYHVGNLIYSLGDAHIYKNHLHQVQTQLQRPTRNLPNLSIVGQDIKSWEDFKIEHFCLENYEPHPAIRAKMAV